MLDGNEKESHSRATQADLSGAYNSLTLPAGGSLTSLTRSSRSLLKPPVLTLLTLDLPPPPPPVKTGPG
ncbi:hypothetical protein PCANC_02334 [Puccinia coronata f. sp. avenae]|uniref:Uncharacterized protein n=1 Tax=Puccinia coronata f. sp. avenae TaxID=200324 RepID=A0A2N5VZ79_9BASI|nr:hypothetical protein PCASD_00121 [Puccinia coronata f. sp. avenae]PLW55314.1 hypothetical protein PCANC_02334 [Puccinia coronata f. sp. avenae]